MNSIKSNLSKKSNLLLFVLIIIPTLTWAQDSTQTVLNGFFNQVYYSKPFISEIHSTMNKVEMGFNKSYSEFDLLEEKSRFDRPMVELHVGFEAPLYAYGFGVKGSNKNWGVGVTLPVSIHVLEDMWGPVTAPVINTDYRFGSPRFIAIRKFSDSKFFHNLSFSWLPLFHECTHLGDEITIYRLEEKFPITRINVSYETTQLQLTLNDPENCRETRNTFRIGYLYRISNRGLGWFSARTNAEIAPDLVIAASKYRGEYYGEYQLQRASGFLASKRFVNIVSFEVRERVRYGYPMFKKVGDIWETKQIKETMMMNLNFYVGYKFYPRADVDHSIGLFFHAFRGVNPFGQLRNYSGYPFFSLALTYEP